jgi:L-histidine N-alpha-methyltransferase
VRITGLDLLVPFAEGEELRTETSAKFRPAVARAELAAAGFELTEWWTDAAERFVLSLATGM